MTKHFIIFLITLLAVCAAHAQDKDNRLTVSGTVVDGNEPLVGVVVSIMDKPSSGTVTDLDGHFTIKVDKGDKLIFSYVGYDKAFYVATDNRQDIKITMKSENKLDELVVTALSSQRKISTLSAVTTVDVNDLQRPVTSVANLLGGRVAGVISTLSSGEPGKNISDFWIRGIGTFGANSSALVLIDGLEGNINDIDPADIESFSVLKDASATAVYGVRGANGVVLINTKRGTADRVQIVGRSSITLSHLSRMPSYLGAYDYAQLANEAAEMRGESPLYDQVTLDIIRYHLDPDIYPNVNWQKETVKRNSWSRNYYASARGGANIAKYFVSLGANIEDAAYKVDKDSPYASNVGYNRYTYRINLDLRLTPTTTMYFGTDGALTQNNTPGVANTDYIWQAQSEINPLRLPTVYSNGQYPAVGTNAGTSPYVLINRMGRRENKNFDGKVTLALDQDLKFITPGLRIRAQGAYDITSTYNEARLIQPALYQAVGRAQNGDLITIKRVDEQSASFSKSVSTYWKYHFESTLNYERLFGEDHRVTGLVYYYMSDEKWSDKATSNITAVPYRYQGLSSRLTYGFRDTYMMDFNFGYTGSENFQKGHHFGFFPSLAVGWVPTNYPWVRKAVPFLDFLKIRASYGTVGNDQISDKRFPYQTIVTRQSNTPFGSASVETLEESYIGADNLRWEKAKKFDLGFEGRLFHEKLQFVIDYFHDTRDGIFMVRQDIPAFVGLVTNPYTNIGKMVSLGADGNASFSQKINKDMDFTIRGNFTYARNDIKRWSEEAPAYPYQEKAGYPYNVQTGYIALGLFKDEADIEKSPVQTFGTVLPGDIKYKDVNGDGMIDSDDKVPIALQNYPLLMYGFGGEFRYKKFTLGIMFKGRGRTEYMRNTVGYIPFYDGVTGNVLSEVANPANRWFTKEYALEHGIDVSLAENPNAKFPRLQYGKNNNNSLPSTFWVGDARYLRLQEITLNYTLQAKWLRTLGINSVDLQLIGENLHTWDKVKTFDPEQAEYSGRAYPIPSTYTFQIYLHL